MRIGIDARELGGRATGVGRYLGGLLREWAVDERARAHEFVLYAPGPIALSLDARRFPTRTVEGSGGVRSSAAGGVAATGADLPSGTAATGTLVSVVPVSALPAGAAHAAAQAGSR